ncbi:MAG: DUF4412 domain-containing protein [Gemmatimonadaceae bacterium]
MKTNITMRAPCLATLALSVALASGAGAQGLSYDILTTGSGTGRGGSPETRTFMAAHGQFAGGKSRLDITESMSRGGMMGAGTYMIMNPAKGTTTMVDPAKREYLELNPSELAKSTAGLQQMVSGMVKQELSGVRVNVEELGAGETIEGYATLKYRITDDYTMKTSIMGRTSETVEHSTTDLWVAPKLDGIMNPLARPASSAATGPMAELTNELTQAYTKMRSGVMLKSIRTSASVTNGKSNSSTMTMTLSNVKRASISASVFEVPSDYAKAASPLDALGAMSDSLNGKSETKDDPKAQAKKALGRFLGRPMT